MLSSALEHESTSLTLMALQWAGGSTSASLPSLHLSQLSSVLLGFPKCYKDDSHSTAKEPRRKSISFSVILEMVLLYLTGKLVRPVPKLEAITVGRRRNLLPGQAQVTCLLLEGPVISKPRGLKIP